jgi:hypothetical protein
MPRWRQDSKTGKLIPIDEAAIRRDAGAAIQGPIEPFVSPIDGTVISDRKQYREHCEKHNVVPAAEFSKEFYERKAKERERLYTGQHSPEQKLKRKQELYEALTRAERNGR